MHVCLMELKFIFNPINDIDIIVQVKDLISLT